ncbi:hypothetical protein D3C84_713540 [compost metagenome]
MPQRSASILRRGGGAAGVRVCHVVGCGCQMWERACSRRRSISRQGCWLCGPHREQARSHRGSVVHQAIVCGRKSKCGSGLAREGGVSGDGDVGCAGLFAGKPAPTGIFGEHRICVWQKSICGSGLAREGGVSGDGDVGCAGLFAGKPAPTGISGEHKICVWQRSNCGSERAREGDVSGNSDLRSENSPPTDSTARPAVPARYKRAMSIANSPPLAGSGC